jgi:hypothetical protein
VLEIQMMITGGSASVILFWKQLDAAATENLFPGHAHDLLEARRQVDEAQLLVQLPQPVTDDFSEVSEALLALLQGFLGKPGIGQVAHAHAHTGNDAGIVAHRLEADTDIAKPEPRKIPPALRADAFATEGAIYGPLNQPGETFPSPRVRGTLPDEVLFLLAEGPQKRAIDRQTGLLGIEYAKHIDAGRCRQAVFHFLVTGHMKLAPFPPNPRRCQSKPRQQLTPGGAASYRVFVHVKSGIRTGTFL